MILFSLTSQEKLSSHCKQSSFVIKQEARVRSKSKKKKKLSKEQKTQKVFHLWDFLLIFVSSFFGSMPRSFLSLFLCEFPVIMKEKYFSSEINHTVELLRNLKIAHVPLQSALYFKKCLTSCDNWRIRKKGIFYCVVVVDQSWQNFIFLLTFLLNLIHQLCYQN